jgi:hypothetical protein
VERNVARFLIVVSEIMMWARMNVDVTYRRVTIIERIARIRPVDYVTVCYTRRC